MRLAAHGHALLLHGFQQGGLSLGRGPIDLVGQHDVGEDRSPLELEDLSSRRIVGEDVGAGDVRRHEIRSELDA